MNENKNLDFFNLIIDFSSIKEHVRSQYRSIESLEAEKLLLLFLKKKVKYRKLKSKIKKKIIIKSSFKQLVLKKK